MIDRGLTGRYEWESASDVEQARRIVAGGSFDLALGDVNAGGERAVALAEEIATGDLDTAVILIAAEDDPDLASRAIGFGAHGYVLEPLSPGQLLGAAMSALRQRELRMIAREASEDLRLSRQETIEGLAMAIEIHDALTGEHVRRVAALAAFLAARLDLDPERVRLLRAAAPMHDVGKIGTSEEILSKPGPLTGHERQTMEEHAVAGHEIFARFDSELAKMAATVAFTHHERYDGGGYPRGLAGEAIPLEGRITAVADVFDALLSDRSYRPARSVEEALSVMVEESGSHFDPEIVDTLLDCVDEALAVRG